MKKHSFYLPRLVKTCSQHSTYETWVTTDFEAGENMFTVEQVEDMINLLRTEPKKHGATLGI